jgi:hypothetical protein
MMLVEIVGYPVPANCAMRGRSSGATSISKYSRRYVSDARKLFACSIGVYANCMIHTLLQRKALVPLDPEIHPVTASHVTETYGRPSLMQIRNIHTTAWCVLTCAPYLRASSLKANSDC